MERICTVILGLLLTVPAFGQFELSSRSFYVPSGGGATPTFKAYTYCPQTTAATTSTATCSGSGGALTVASGDLVGVFCFRVDTSITGFTAGDTQSNTYAALTANASSYPSEQMSWATASASGSVNFTCTAASGGQAGLIAVDYSGTGATANTQANSGRIYNAAVTTGTYSTTQRTLNIYCATDYGSGTWTAGAIGAGTGTLVAFDGASNTSRNAACESYVSTSTMSSVTASISSSGSSYGLGTVLAVNY